MELRKYAIAKREGKTMSKQASLVSGLVKTEKGKAAPSVQSTLITNQNKDNRIAVTVKLLERPYLKMKTHSALNRKSNQDILEEALNAYLEKLTDV